MVTRSVHHEPLSTAGASPRDDASGRSRRIASIDLFRGLAILEVVLHHLTGTAMRHAEAGSALYTLLAVTNRTLHFAVPAFLFMTAVVLTRSALQNFHVGRFYWGRFKKSLLPYLIWTVLYVLFRVYSKQDPPSVLTDPARWHVWIQYGKGYFHLYFLLIALQFYLVLPLLLPLWRRRIPFLGALALAITLQLVVYFLNRGDTLNFRYPGTMALWYIPAITLGMYFGANYAQFEGFWKRWRHWIIGVTVAALAWYVPTAIAALLGERVNTMHYSFGHWVYTTSMALTLFGVAHSLTRSPRWVQRPLARLGTVSLQIYLLHPLLLFYVTKWGYPQEPAAFLLVLLGYAVAALGVPFIVARALEGTRMSTWLFGR